ncbi:MAG: M56 family metallopeptidase [Planctomycetaceae bacterium]
MNDFLRMLWTQAWQIAMLAIMVAFCTRMIAKNRPHLAHALWLLVLVKCVTPPMWGHSLGVFSRLQALTLSVEKTSDSALAEVRSLQTESVLVSSFSSDHESESHLEPDFAVHRSTQPIARDENSDATNVTAIQAPEFGEPTSVDAVRPDRVLWPGLLLSCLAIGAAATLSLMIVRCLRCLRRIHRHRTSEFDQPLNERLQLLAKKLHLRRVPRIIVSDVLFGPAVLGVLRHTIVLPRCLLQTSRSFLPERTFAEGEPARRSIDIKSLSEGSECTRGAASHEVLPGRQDLPKPLPGRQDLEFLDPILAHELLHIRRGDLRTGLLQAIVQSLWWFHPAVWFSNRWLSREAERCCDEQVIAELGCSPAQYARSLLSVIESKHQLQPIPVFPGMKPVEITTQRMERIMSLKTGLKKQTPLWCWLAVAGLAIVVLPGAVAKPQSEEKAVETQPEEMGLPQETKIADAPEVEVSTKTYVVGDLIERLAKEQNLSSDQARKSLLQIFESSVVPVHRNVQGVPAPPVNLPQPLPPADLSTKVIPMAGAVSTSATEIKVLSSYALNGDRMVVVQSAAGHATLQEYIDAVHEHGFTTFQVTARYIMGPPEEINSLMEALHQEKPFPKAADGKTVAKPSQSETQLPQSAAAFGVGTSGVVSIEEARKIEELARSKAGCLSMQCPKVSAIDGQVATIQTGETKPFIVGFKENDEPMIRTVVEGLTLRVIPKVVDKGLFQLKSVACLEGASERRLMTMTGRVTETPKMFTLPAITERRLQTTVELRENQAFLQSGMITTEEGKTQAFLAVLEARLVAPERVFMKEPFVETTIDADLIPRLASDEGLGQTEATQIVKIMIDEAMNADRPLSVNATTIVANGESLIVRHPQALAARLKKVLTQIRMHGFAQSRLNVCIAVLPDIEATRLLRKHSMVTAEAEIVGNVTYVSRSAAAEPTSKLEFEALQFCNFTLREVSNFKNEIAALSNSTLLRCRQDLLVVNGEPTSIKSHLNPAITGLENQLPGELLEVTVLPRNRRLYQLSLKVHASELSGSWSCEVTDDQACVVQGLTRIRPTGEKDVVLFIVSAGAAGHHTDSDPATEEKVVYPDDPYAARRDQNADNATQPSNDRTSVGDSANAIRLHEDFGWSPAIQPRTIVAYVNDKPITVLDIVPAAHQLFQFSISQTIDMGQRNCLSNRRFESS